MTEKELQAIIAKYLSRYFYVEQEVWSVNYKKRIDIAMVHRLDIEKDYPIGIEIKTFDKKTGSDAGKWLKQSQTYSELDFVGYGKMLIIIAPQFSGNVFLEGTLMSQHMQDGYPGSAHNVSTFLGQFNLGEFQTYYRINYKTSEKKKYARVVYNGQIIWNEHDNRLRTNNYPVLCKR